MLGRHHILWLHGCSLSPRYSLRTLQIYGYNGINEARRGHLRQAHSGEVRRDAKVRLRAALGDAEASHHLIEAQQRAVLGRDVPQALSKHNSESCKHADTDARAGYVKQWALVGTPCIGIRASLHGH